MKSLDEKYMRMALRLAERAKGRTSPNPMVGAVVVKNGHIVGRGYHRKAGEPHAEAIALKKAGPAAKGATLYVTLEPCSHTNKRTPPCTPLVIRSGVKRVVMAMIDPNPRVSGGGIRTIRKSGTELVTGVLEAEAKKLNEAFIKHVTTKMPFATLKIAQTLDGKIATASGESKWITSEEAREEGHRLRDINDAILVGINTVLKDNPSLTTRIHGGRDPIRVIVDSRLRIPLNAKVLIQKSPAKTMIATLSNVPESKIKKLQNIGAEVLTIKNAHGRVDLRDLLKKLGKKDIMSVLIEGGAEVNASALQSNIVDKIVMFIAPAIMTGKDSLCSVGGISPKTLDHAIKLHSVTSRFIGQDLMIEGYIR
ncbi:MAG TPA: bifunctional diaminohydroxyphosphoribosylaminopyrimidine deaminase/5-amino-6-(5-phosphoribosylamino)uracil reductase RibD [Nitrospirota bacterium]|nr:bifunctional diaminohydroxyphosphoribosylaminopyrimidine deaminase/5-amino-6-(5-phosphoribosylamino)uracil reductase RibD [Nitrospirota bacterium]